MGAMKPADQIKTVILAAKLAHESLELLTMHSTDLCRLQFRQIVVDLKALEEHLNSIEWPVASRPWESGGFIPGKGWFREKNGA